MSDPDCYCMITCSELQIYKLQMTKNIFRLNIRTIVTILCVFVVSMYMKVEQCCIG